MVALLSLSALPIRMREGSESLTMKQALRTGAICVGYISKGMFPILLIDGRHVKTRECDM